MHNTVSIPGGQHAIGLSVLQAQSSAYLLVKFMLTILISLTTSTLLAKEIRIPRKLKRLVTTILPAELCTMSFITSEENPWTHSSAKEACMDWNLCCKKKRNNCAAILTKLCRKKSRSTFLIYISPLH